MSSTIPSSPVAGNQSMDDSIENNIPHFDATLRRKEKMRNKAAQQPGKTSVSGAVKKNGSNGHTNGSAKTNGFAAVAAPVVVATPVVATPAPVAVPTPVAVAPVAATPQLSGEALEQFLINFVVEQTGYPPEMVEMDADLEADLGIDSIKKAQLFGELANEFGAEASDDLSLDEFTTLRHVKKFLENSGSGSQAETVSEPVLAAPAPVVAPVVAPVSVVHSAPIVVPEAVAPVVVPEVVAPAVVAATPQLSGAALETYLVNFVVEQTGYPPEMVEMDADLEADLGIDSIKKAQLFGELANEFGMETSDDLSLDDFTTLRHVKTFLEGASSEPALENSPVVAVNGSATNGATNGSVTNGFSVNGNGHSSFASLPTSVAVNGNGFAATNGAVATAVTTSAVATSAAVESTTGLSGEALETYLVNFVVEQTGYPPEMVEMDADLEADLGIDSIKKAQLFGELANEFGAEASDDLSLDDFTTLRHVKGFLEKGSHVTV